MTALQSRCVFCNTREGKRTREHVWRRALRQRFAPASGLTFWQHSVDAATVQTRPISQFDITVNAVCSNCNAGWLNDLEDRALPTLDYFGLGSGRLPSIAELRDFAFWAVTRALLRTHASPSGRAPSYLFDTIYEYRDSRVIPPGCIVSIASTDQVDMEAGFHQSVRLDDEYLGHVSVAFGSLFISTMLGGPGQLTTSLAELASNQLEDWFPSTFRQLAPSLGLRSNKSTRRLSAAEAKVGGSCLGFFLGRVPCDQFGTELDLGAVVPVNRIGLVPWPLVTGRNRP